MFSNLTPLLESFLATNSLNPENLEIARDKLETLLTSAYNQGYIAGEASVQNRDHLDFFVHSNN